MKFDLCFIQNNKPVLENPMSTGSLHASQLVILNMELTNPWVRI